MPTALNEKLSHSQLLRQPSGTAWFEQARFGLFAHWGIYSLLGHEDAEWVLFKSNLNRLEYNRLADQFTGARFDANALVGLAKRAGAGYCVFTTRHHDGFCLYDTQTSDFNSVKTAAGRDFVREYVEACRGAGLRVGLYFSVMSWQHDAIYTGPFGDPEGWERMVAETHAQVRELMTHYGKIDVLWYDGAVVPGIQEEAIVARFWRSRELNAMVRELQPEILINPRSGLPEDFSTPEQHVRPPARGRRWEACMTINGSWGYNIHDRAFKQPAEIVRSLIRCARYGGNLLLNIGPRGDGTIQQECMDCLESVGAWLACNGESIRGSERTAFTEAEHVAGPTTQKGRRLYLHLTKPLTTDLLIDGVGQIEDAWILGEDRVLTVTPGPGRAARLSGIGHCSNNGLPRVVGLVLTDELGAPARLLGGGDDRRICDDSGSVCGDDPDRHAPTPEPVRTGKALASWLRAGQAVERTPGDSWCPGLGTQEVLSPVNGNPLMIQFEVPVAGRYDVALGVTIADEGGALKVTLDDQIPLMGGGKLQPGCADTWQVSGQRFEAGQHVIALESASRFGLYAMCLEPVWRVMPSEVWQTVGPFETGFTPQNQLPEVCRAMSKVYPPELGFDPEATYVGTGGKPIRWTQSGKREGEHSDCGVNFPYRCGVEVSGVCYARAIVVSPEKRRAMVTIGCDWWANLWLNGELVRSTRDAEACEKDNSQFNTWKPTRADIELAKGENIFLIKCHRGGNACWFTFRISDPGDLAVQVLG